MVNKKAFMKTLEALISVVLLLIFITAIFILNSSPKKETIPEDIKLSQDIILNKIETDQNLRTCLAQNNDGCIRSTILSSLLPTVEYDINICVGQNPSSCQILTNLAEKVYVRSLMIEEEGTMAILRLYMWHKL